MEAVVGKGAACPLMGRRIDHLNRGIQLFFCELDGDSDC